MIVEENDIKLISEFEYANYMAQKELLDELALISIKFNETTILNEANIKGAIMNYIHKIVNNIQVAWNKFKRKITNTAWGEIKKTYGQELTMNRALEIKEVSDSDVFVSWEEVFKFLSPGLRIDIYKNNTSKNELTETDIVKQIPYFSSLDNFSKQDMQKFVTGKCFIPMRVGNNIDLKTVTEYSGYLDNLDKIMSPIEDEIKIFNEIEKEIERHIDNKEDMTGRRVELPGVKNPTKGQPQTAQEAYNIVLNKACEYLYMTEFKSEDKADPNGEDTVKNGGNTLQKEVTRTMKVVTTYLSTKMWIANKATSKSLVLVLAYVRNAAKYNLNKRAADKKKAKAEAKNNNEQ